MLGSVHAARYWLGHFVKRYILRPTYRQRLNKELSFYRDRTEIHDLPPIFHYWSNRYLRPKLNRLGLARPEDIFLSYARRVLDRQGESLRLLSLGAGNCDIEIDLVKSLVAAGQRNFVLECVEINPHMLERARRRIDELGLSDFFALRQCDLNDWHLDCKYSVIIANQVLHHVVALESLFASIQQSLATNGYFLVSDLIGRNGHRRWPEALLALQPFWDELPERYRYHHVLRRVEKRFINYDSSRDSLEGIRAQDILPLLVDHFHFDLFLGFANIIYVFIDRPFGPNFDTKKEWDRSFIDRVQARDEAGLLSGELKPTQMVAALCTFRTETKLIHPRLTPHFSVRKTE